MKKFIYNFGVFLGFVYLCIFCINYYAKSPSIDAIFDWIPDVNPIVIIIMTVVSFVVLFNSRKLLKDKTEQYESDTYGPQQVYLSPNSQVKLLFLLFWCVCIIIYSTVVCFSSGIGPAVGVFVFLSISSFLIIENLSDFILFVYGENEDEKIEIKNPSFLRGRNKEYGYGLFPGTHEPGIPFEGEEKERNEQIFKQRIGI